MPILISGQAGLARVFSERQAATTVFGRDNVNEMVQSANGIYAALMKDTGLDGYLRKGYVTQEEQNVGTPLDYGITNLTNQSNGYLYSLATNIFGIIFRLAIILKWIGLIAPFLAAAIIDGLVQRKVKSETLGFHSPVRFSLAAHVLILISAVPLLYLLAPLPITPWFMVLWALAIVIPLRVVIANAVRGA